MSLVREADLRGNIAKCFGFNFFLNLQLWWPICIIYLKEERRLSQPNTQSKDLAAPPRTFAVRRD